MSQQGKQGVTPDQLYQNLMKNITNISSGIQLMFEGVGQMSAELQKVSAELAQLKGKAMPKTAGTEPEPKFKVNTKKKKK